MSTLHSMGTVSKEEVDRDDCEVLDAWIRYKQHSDVIANSLSTVPSLE